MGATASACSTELVNQHMHAVLLRVEGAFCGVPCDGCTLQPGGSVKIPVRRATHDHSVKEEPLLVISVCSFDTCDFFRRGTVQPGKTVDLCTLDPFRFKEPKQAELAPYLQLRLPVWPTKTQDPVSPEPTFPLPLRMLLLGKARRHLTW